MHDGALSFWFDELEPAPWWRADPAVDAVIRARFAVTHRAAVAGELWPWRYLHRNAILGRPSTEEEPAFLQSPGSRF
jgi:uncharacterized protein (DUF924 family)